MARLDSGWALLGLIITAATALAGGLDRLLLAHQRLCLAAFFLLMVGVVAEAFGRLAERSSEQTTRAPSWAEGIAILAVVSAFFCLAIAFVRAGDGDDRPDLRIAFDEKTRQARVTVRAQYFDPREAIDVQVQAFAAEPFPKSRRDALLPIEPEGTFLLRATVGADASGKLAWSAPVAVPTDGQRLLITAGERPKTRNCAPEDGVAQACLYVAIPFDEACREDRKATAPRQCVLTKLRQVASGP